ncbi:hypothetical protein Lal_00024325 [Lupinus albus]|nr:hypothetical protein Lal_00024325 [Lupinus albus]
MTNIVLCGGMRKDPKVGGGVGRTREVAKNRTSILTKRLRPELTRQHFGPSLRGNTSARVYEATLRPEFTRQHFGPSLRGNTSARLTLRGVATSARVYVATLRPEFKRHLTLRVVATSARVYVATLRPEFMRRVLLFYCISSHRINSAMFTREIEKQMGPLIMENIGGHVLEESNWKHIKHTCPDKGFDLAGAIDFQIGFITRKICSEKKKET